MNSRLSVWAQSKARALVYSAWLYYKSTLDLWQANLNQYPVYVLVFLPLFYWTGCEALVMGMWCSKFWNVVSCFITASDIHIL